MLRLQAGLKQHSGWPTLLHNAVQSCHPVSNTQDSETGATTARCRGVLPELSTVVKDAEAASRAEAAF